MAKITLTDLANLENENTAVSNINANNALIETAFENTLSRDGTAPNQMLSQLDMNSNRIINLPQPVSASEPARLQDLSNIGAGGTIVINPLPTGGTTGQVATKNSNSNYDVNWSTPHYFPTGGTAGQLLSKSSNSDYATTWINQPTLTYTVTVTSLASLQAVDTTLYQMIYLNAGGRSGLFGWTTGNFSAQVTNDPLKGVYVAANAVASTSGVWKRLAPDGWVDVKWFGAIGDNSTDDYSAIQAAITYIGYNLGGTVYFSAGGYKIGTGLTVTVSNTKLEGAGCRRSSITSTVVGINMITVSAPRCVVELLSIFNQVRTGVTSAILTLTTGAVQCTVDSCWIVGGFYCMAVKTSGSPTSGTTGATDNIISNCVMLQSYGGAIVYVRQAGTAFFKRCLFNQDWPNPATVNQSSVNGGVRLGSTAYNVGDYVTYNSFFLQCVTSTGATSGTPPDISNLTYGVPLVDGGITWYLAGNASGVAVLVDSASTYTTLEDCDMTGAFLFSFWQVNNQGGTSNIPDNTYLHKCTSGGIRQHSFVVDAAKRIWIVDCEMQVPTGIGTSRGGIVLNAGFAGDAIIKGNSAVSGFNYGVYLAGSGTYLVTGNSFTTGNGTGVYVAGGTSNFTVTSNMLGTSPTWGNNPSGSVIVATGASDNYIITDNRIFGSPAIVDNGTGSNKVKTPNI